MSRASARSVATTMALIAALALVGCAGQRCTRTDKQNALSFITAYYNTPSLQQWSLDAGLPGGDPAVDATLQGKDEIKAMEKAKALSQESWEAEKAGDLPGAQAKLDQAKKLRPNNWEYMAQDAGLKAKKGDIAGTKTAIERTETAANATGNDLAVYAAKRNITNEIDDALWSCPKDATGAPIGPTAKALARMLESRASEMADLTAERYPYRLSNEFDYVKHYREMANRAFNVANGLRSGDKGYRYPQW